MMTDSDARAGNQRMVQRTSGGQMEPAEDTKNQRRVQGTIVGSGNTEEGSGNQRRLHRTSGAHRDPAEATGNTEGKREPMEGIGKQRWSQGIIGGHREPAEARENQWRTQEHQYTESRFHKRGGGTQHTQPTREAL